jgi:hypothetical protein
MVVAVMIGTAVFSGQLSEALLGAVIFAAGAILIIFRGEVAATMRAIGANAFVKGTTLEDATSFRPTTVVLFGMAMCIVGVASMVSAYAHV